MQDIANNTVGVNVSSIKYRVWDDTDKKYVRNPYFAPNGKIYTAKNMADRQHILDLEISVGISFDGHEIYVGDFIKNPAVDDCYWLIGYEHGEGPYAKYMDRSGNEDEEPITDIIPGASIYGNIHENIELIGG